jgi:hypothetical protein
MIRVRGSTELYMLEADRAVRRVTNAEQFSADRLAGVTVAGGVWHFALAQASTVSIYRVENDEAELVGSYPQFSRDGGVVTRLVGRTDGRGLALWSKTAKTGWYLFPVDPGTGEASSAIPIALDLLREIPAPCELAANGYQLVSQVPLTDLASSRSNTHVDFADLTGPGVTSVMARLTANRDSLCVSGVGVTVDGAFPAELGARRLGRTSERPILLTATDVDGEAQTGFECTR